MIQWPPANVAPPVGVLQVSSRRPTHASLNTQRISTWPRTNRPPSTVRLRATPPPVITWYRNGQPVITANENPSSHRMLLPSGQLFFLRIIHNKNNKPDVGSYYCVATNPATRVSVQSRNATLEIGGKKKKTFFGCGGGGSRMSWGPIKSPQIL